MTAPVAVDVLAVLDMATERERAAGMPDGVQMAAHDAVDELLLIGREVEQADRDGILTDELMDCFRVALARCGGAQ